MGTRGAVGFRLNGKDYITYNHWDSYPSGLGLAVIKDIKKIGLKGMPDLPNYIGNIELVKGNSTPTPEQIKNTEPWHNLTVSEQSYSDWYCLIRDAQGTLLPYMTGKLRYMVDSHDFLFDSLFCEYAYIINLDDLTLEFYRGFNKNPEAAGRYAFKKGENGYCGVELRMEVSLTTVLSTQPKVMVKKLEKATKWVDEY